MFRRKRASSNPPLPPATASSATSAAALAFLNKRASDASLSASAAAAALRSHTTSPEPVSSVQTKRMMRRGSTSSFGSETASVRQPFSSGVQGVQGAQRPASATSMRQRSFRSPSPAGRKAPTLPTVPDDVPPIPVKSHRRTPSTESSTTRPPPPRVSSPVASNASGNINGGAPAMTVRYDPNTRTVVRVPVQNRIQSGNPGSRPPSVNFSRPMSPPLTHNSTPREQVRARPATAQGFSTADSIRAQPPMPNPSQMAAVLSQQAKPPQTTAATSTNRPKGAAAPRPVSSAGVSSGALLAASTAARPVSDAAPAVVPASSNLSAAKPTVPQTRAVSMPTAIASGGPPPAPSTQARAKTPVPATTQAARPVVAKGPSEEEIKVFQTRAAAMLARPLSDTTAIAPITADTASTARAVPILTKPAEAPPAQKPETTNPALNPPSLSVDNGSVARAPSHSPSRSAHFSQSPLIENIKHQPPARDVSPAKSAMKAPSPRSSSPAGSPMRSTTETSEKKNARVSFDEQAVLVGEAASPMTPVSSTIASPQYQKGVAYPFESGSDHEYTPRPTLPSFGSVRGRSTSPNPGGEASQATDPASSTPVQSSSDDVVGSVLAQDFATRGGASSELADGVTTNETDPENIPSISVLPATPRIDQENKTLGGPEEIDSSRSAEEGTPVLDSQPRSLNVPGAFVVEDNESEEHLDSFADATEDQTDPEADGGYASLDAIIESPGAEGAPQINPLANTTTEGTTARGILGTAVTTTEPAVAGTAAAEGEDWERIRKYWSSLSEQRKQELEREAAKKVSTSESADELAPIKEIGERAVPSSGTQLEPTQPSSILVTSAQPPLPPWPDRQYQESAKAATPPMKQTLRSSHQRMGSEPSHMRTSMRDGNPPSSAAIEPKTKPVPNQRPKSAIIITSASNASAVAAMNAQTSPKQSTKPALNRTLSSESSASESSFRRKRGNSVASSEGGGYTMKRSMRGQAPSEAARTTSPTPSRSNRFSFQSISPSSQKPARTSLRGTADSATPTLRANGFRSSDQRAVKSSGPKMGFGRSSKPTKTTAKSGSRFKSRFNDSSDEDEDDTPRFAAFRSRYDDSDDEDAPKSPQKLAPVRGIPRKPGQTSGDSTDLEDSDDGGATFVADEATMAAARRNIAARTGTVVPSTPPNATSNANGAAEGKLLHAGTLRADPSAPSSPSSPTQQGKTKRGFFTFGKKKQGAVSQPSSPLATAGSPKAANVVSTTGARTTQGAGGSKLLRRLSSSGMGTEAKAPTTQTSDTPYVIPPIPAIPDFYNQDSNDQLATVNRPNTSDGTSVTKMPKTMRPTMGEKRESAMTAPLVGDRAPIVSDRTGRKKKFQGLRRWLNMHD